MNPTSIGGRIRHVRAQKGLTQGGLAAMVGVHRLTVQAWESGNAEPRLTALYRLASMLKIQASWLIEGTGPNPLDCPVPFQSPTSTPKEDPAATGSFLATFSTAC